MNIRNCICALLFCVMTGLTANAQERQVSLEECIAMAMENHPEIRISLEESKKAEASYGVSKAPNSVIVNGEVKTVEILKTGKSTGNFNVPGKDTSIGLFAGATAAYNIYDATKGEKQMMARLGISLAQINQLRIKSKVLLNVKVAYYDFLFARQSVALKDDLRGKYGTKLDKTRMLFRNGQRPILDVTKAEVDLANANLDYERAINLESFARTELLTAIGVPGEDFTVVPIPVDSLPELRFTLDQLYDIAEDEYPEIRIARLNRTIQKINIDAEKANRNPSVDVVTAFGMENRNLQGQGGIQDNLGPDKWKPTFHVALQARMPLYSGGLISGRIDSAKADYRKTFYAERQVTVTNRALIQNFIQSMAELKRQVELAKLMKVNAENHVKLATKSYENGLGSQLDLQDAESSLINADLYSYKARYDYLIALARLANSVGVKEEQLCK